MLRQSYYLNSSGVPVLPVSPSQFGHELEVVFRQDSQGGHTVSWDSSFLQASGSSNPGQPLTTPNSVTVFKFVNMAVQGSPIWVRQYTNPDTVSLKALDLVGHSIAGGGGAIGSNLFGGWVDRLVQQLQPGRVRDASKGGSIVSLVPDGAIPFPGGSKTYGGMIRTLYDFPMQTDYGGAMQPLLAQSQLAIVWHGLNDIGWLGPGGLPSIKEGIRQEIARFRAAHVFEDSQIAVVNGIQPNNFSGTTAWTAASLAFYASNGDYTYNTVAYTAANNIKNTIQVSPDINWANPVLGFGFLVSNANAAVWELHDVTAGDTLLATWDLRNLGPTIPGVTQTNYLNVLRRQALGAAPSTTLSGAQYSGNGTLNVASTALFASAGVLRGDEALISYTGKTATSFTGCTQIGGTYSLTIPDGTTIYGSRNLELRPTTVVGNAFFDFWHVEAQNPGLVMVPLHYRPLNYAIWATWPYSRTLGQVSAAVAAGTNQIVMGTTTVTNAMGTTGDIGAVGSLAAFDNFGVVVIGTEKIYVAVMANNAMTQTTRGLLGSTAATHTAGSTVYPYVRAGDTITLNPGGANQETLTVQSVTGATIVFTTNMVNAHSANESFVAGIQDADVTSLNSNIQSVVNEFDANVFTVPVDDLFSTSGGRPNYQYIAQDGVHPNDLGHALIAERFLSAIRGKLTLLNATRTDPSDWGPANDTDFQMLTFQNSYINYNSNIVFSETSGQAYPLRFWKSLVTGEVRIEGAVAATVTADVTNGAVITTLPVGARPGFDIVRAVAAANGPAIIRIGQDGTIRLIYGGSATWTDLSCTFQAER